MQRQVRRPEPDSSKGDLMSRQAESQTGQMLQPCLYSRNLSGFPAYFAW